MAFREGLDVKILIIYLCLPWVWGQVFELTNDTFEMYTRDKDIMLIEFIAPWCPHCRALQPEWEKAAKVLASNKEFVLAKVDCINAGKSLCDRFKVDMYPMIKLFRHGIFSEEYDGERQAGPILEFVQRAQQSSGVARDSATNPAPISPGAPVGTANQLTIAAPAPVPSPAYVQSSPPWPSEPQWTAPSPFYQPPIPQSPLPQQPLPPLAPAIEYPTPGEIKEWHEPPDAVLNNAQVLYTAYNSPYVSVVPPPPQAQAMQYFPPSPAQYVVPMQQVQPQLPAPPPPPPALPPLPPAPVLPMLSPVAPQASTWSSAQGFYGKDPYWDAFDKWFNAIDVSGTFEDFATSSMKPGQQNGQLQAIQPSAVSQIFNQRAPVYRAPPPSPLRPTPAQHTPPSMWNPQAYLQRPAAQSLALPPAQPQSQPQRPVPLRLSPVPLPPIKYSQYQSHPKPIITPYTNKNPERYAPTPQVSKFRYVGPAPTGNPRQYWHPPAPPQKQPSPNAYQRGALNAYADLRPATPYLGSENTASWQQLNNKNNNNNNNNNNMNNKNIIDKNNYEIHDSKQFDVQQIQRFLPPSSYNLLKRQRPVEGLLKSPVLPSRAETLVHQMSFFTNDSLHLQPRIPDFESPTSLEYRPADIRSNRKTLVSSFDTPLQRSWPQLLSEKDPISSQFYSSHLVNEPQTDTAMIRTKIASQESVRNMPVRGNVKAILPKSPMRPFSLKNTWSRHFPDLHALSDPRDRFINARMKTLPLLSNKATYFDLRGPRPSLPLRLLAPASLATRFRLNIDGREQERDFNMAAAARSAPWNAKIAQWQQSVMPIEAKSRAFQAQRKTEHPSIREEPKLLNIWDQIYKFYTKSKHQSKPQNLYPRPRLSLIAFNNSQNDFERKFSISKSETGNVRQEIRKQDQGIIARARKTSDPSGQENRLLAQGRTSIDFPRSSVAYRQLQSQFRDSLPSILDQHQVEKKILQSSREKEQGMDKKDIENRISEKPVPWDKRAKVTFSIDKKSNIPGQPGKVVGVYGTLKRKKRRKRKTSRSITKRSLASKASP